jgi:hypothetical protein
MPPSPQSSFATPALGAVSNTPFTDQNGLLTLSALTLLQQICNALFGTTALTVQTVFSGLPSSPTRGETATITDSNTNAWGAVISGGGAYTVMAWFNSSGNWTVIGK